MRRIIIILLICCGVQQARAQQNVQFSQYVFNMLSVNPAYAGYKEDWYLQAAYRHQWMGISGAPQTGIVSIDGLAGANEQRVGVGAQLGVDRIGPQEALSAYGFYNYRIPLDDENTRRLCIGLGGGITQYSIDGTALKYVDDLDMAIPVGKTSTIIPDARVGVYYYTPKFYAGLSVMDLFSLYTDNTHYYWGGQNYRTIRKTQHLYLTTGYMVELSDQLKLKPSLMVKEDFKGPTNLDVTAFLLIADKLWLGGSYRTGVKLWKKPALNADLDPLDAASALVEFYATPQLRIGYAYDLSINKLASYQQGSHEISIGFLFNSKKSRITSPRYF